MLRALVGAAWLCLGVACAQAGPPRGVDGAPSWDEVDAVDTIELVTVDPDGDVRETTVWLGVLDGAGYIRTGSSRWFANLERDPRLRVRIEVPAEADTVLSEYRMRVEKITDATQRGEIAGAFRAKYGFFDRLVIALRGSDLNMMRLLADTTPAGAAADAEPD